MNDIYMWKKYFQWKSKPSKPPSPLTTSHFDFLDELRGAFMNFGIEPEEKESALNKILVTKAKEISTRYVTEIQTRLQIHLDRAVKIKTELHHLNRETPVNLAFNDEERELLTTLVNFVRGTPCRVTPTLGMTQTNRPEDEFDAHSLSGHTTIADLREVIFGEVTPRRGHLEDNALPTTLEGSVNADKLTAFCEKLGVLVYDDYVAMILFEDHLWEIDLERGKVHVKSRTVEGRETFICLEWDYTTGFSGYSKAFSPRELLILAKIVAILTGTLPEDVKSSVEKFLKEGTGAPYVSPLGPIGLPQVLSLRSNLQSELREIFRQRGLLTDAQ